MLDSRTNFRKDLENAGLSALAADLLANLFTAQQRQIGALAGVAFDGVRGAFGLAQYPLAAASGVIARGMLVRTTANSVVPATSASGDARVWANAFVLGVEGGIIFTAQGAAEAPLMVTSPVQGQKVSVLRGGMGTCAEADGDIQPVATCEVPVSTNGLCACSSVAFQVPLNRSLDGKYIRMAYDNYAPNRTGLINTLLEGTTGAPFGTLFYVRNLGGVGANGLSVEMPNGGTGNGIAVTVTGAMGGVNVTADVGEAILLTNDSSAAFALFCANNDASLRHASFGSDLFVIGPRVFFHSIDTVNGAIILEATTPSGATQTQTLQDATGTIALLEAPQTFTGHQNFDAMGAIVADYARENITAASFAFDADGVSVIMFDSDAAYTLTSTPTIDNAVDGQILTITNLGTFNVTLQDDSILGGSELKLSAGTVTLGPNDSISLLYVGENSWWVQTAFSNNL